MAQNKRTGIRQYHRIRQYLGKIYLYGFFKRSDFGAMHDGSAKDYTFIMGLIRELLEPEQKRDMRRIPRRYHRNSSRVLTDSYMYHTMDPDTDMVQYLHILRFLAVAGENATAVHEKLSFVFGDAISLGTVRNRLKTLAEYGCVEKTAGGKYILRDDPLQKLTDGQLVQLYRYVCFAAGTTYPRVAGSFLCRTLERVFYQRGLDVPLEHIRMRHNSNHNVFDEELVSQLQQWIFQRRWVHFDDRKRLPVQLRIDGKLGRWYVLCADEKHLPCIEKITNIEKELTAGETIDPLQWDALADTVKAAFAHTLCSGKQTEPVLVEAKLNFAGAEGLHRQFLREIRLGQVEQRDDGEYYVALCSDPVELKPFLRSYAPYLRILPGEHGLAEMICSDLRQMLQKLDEEGGL